VTVACLKRPVGMEGEQQAHSVDLGLDRPAVRVGDRSLQGADAVVGDKLGQDLGNEHGWIVARQGEGPKAGGEPAGLRPVYGDVQSARPSLQPGCGSRRGLPSQPGSAISIAAVSSVNWPAIVIFPLTS
jgi:hypothetical protein